MFFWVNQRPFLRYLMAESGDGLHWEVADFERPIIYHPLELGAWIWTPGVLPPVEVQDRGPDQETLGRFVPGEEAQWGHLLERLDADELVRLKGLRANDAVYVYRDVEHGQYELYAPWPMCNIEGSPRRWEDDNAPFMGLATAADGIGRLWTRPFVLSGTELCVDARLDGCLRAELCDPFGKTLPGFESDRCQLVSGDRVDHVLRWEGAAVAPYQYNAVSLRLEVERGAIYNIHWRRDAT